MPNALHTSTFHPSLQNTLHSSNFHPSLQNALHSSSSRMHTILGIFLLSHVHTNTKEVTVMEKETTQASNCNFKIADLPLSCRDKFEEFEHELNRQGYWNIAVVAYQKE